MADFTAADVKRLRDATGAGMMDCKKALTEAAPLPETPAEPPAVSATEVAPVAGVPATGDTTTGTQGAQNG